MDELVIGFFEILGYAVEHPIKFVLWVGGYIFIFWLALYLKSLN